MFARAGLLALCVANGAFGQNCLEDSEGDETQLVQFKQAQGHELHKSNSNTSAEEGELAGIRNANDPLLCVNAEPQTPRDLTPGFVGDLRARITPLDGDVVKDLIQVNLHWHLGAEHFRQGEYDIPVFKHKYGHNDGLEWNGKPLVPADVRPGFFCNLRGFDDYLKPFDFKHCVDAKVGYTYEFHWVFSTAGPLTDEFTIWPGLGQAFNRSLNPTALVRGQVCRIINDESLQTEEQLEQDYNNFIAQWRQPSIDEGVRYMGSTTGTSFNNEVCSPLQVHWHVDTKCCTLTAQTLDRTCKEMAAFGLTSDLRPQNSRELVNREFVSKVVFPLTESD